MIDKAEVESRFRKSVESYEENAHVQKIIVNHLTALMKAYCHLSHPRILEIGCGTGLLTEQLCRNWKDSHLMINDLVGEMCSKTAIRNHISPEYCISGDIEMVTLNGKFNLIASASTFQWLEQPALTLSRLSEHIIGDGWLIFSTFGEDNLKEVKSITGNGLVYRSINDMITLLSPCFEVLQCEESRHTLKFSSPLEVLKHIKRTGVNAIGQPSIWTRGKMNEFSTAYASRFMSNGDYPLTYHPQYFICRKRENAD